MAAIPSAYLQRPEKAPLPRRNADGNQTGEQAHATQLDLYDVIGSLRGQLVRLQCAVLAAQGMPIRDDCTAAPRAGD
jgi:hypothetical protein